MAIDKNALPSEAGLRSITKLLGAETEMVYRAYAYQHGSATVLEIEYMDATSGFIKVTSNGAVEVGGVVEQVVVPVR